MLYPLSFTRPRESERARAGRKLELYEAIARQLRADSIRCSTAAGSGHPTSSLSAADLMAVLLAVHLRYDWSSPENPANDHLLFSKDDASLPASAISTAIGSPWPSEPVAT